MGKIKKVCLTILRVIGLSAVSISMLLFILLYFMTYNVEWHEYEINNFSGFYRRFDGVRLSTSLIPIGSTTKISFPFRTSVRKAPYEFSIRMHIVNQDINAILFGKLTRILPDGQEIDFWHENIRGGRSFPYNPYVFHDGYFGKKGADTLRENRRIELTFNNTFNGQIYDSIHIVFSPVDIDFKTVDFFVLKFDIGLEFNSGEIVMHEMIYDFRRRVRFIPWEEVSWN